jgi:hypothetical protein
VPAFCEFDFVGIVYSAMEQNATRGTVAKNNVFTSVRKQAWQIAEHFRHFHDFLDSDTLLQACRWLATYETGLFLVVTRHEIFPFKIDRTFKPCRWAALFRLRPNACKQLSL